MNWETVGRPGYLGKRRDITYQKWNKEYGENNWRLVWKHGNQSRDFLGACELYEDAYFIFLLNNRCILKELTESACDVYDDALSNIESGINYSLQETGRTHIQDIAIRRSLIRLGEEFEGKELIQIRDRLGEHPLSMKLSPGIVPFHLPEKILEPQLEGWWEPGSVESFYQSNRLLEARGGS